MEPRALTVGIPTCDDDPAVLSLALDAIAREPVAACLVVDMSATDAIEKVVRGHRRAEYVSFAESRGVSNSRNRIVELAQTRYVLFLDADAVPRPGWAAAFADALAHARPTLVGARILPRWPRRPPRLLESTVALELLGMLDLGPEPCELPRVMGTSFALDRERLPSDGPFRHDLGHRDGRWIGQEEVQLSLDVRAAGGSIRYEPRAVVEHHIRPERASWRWLLRRVYLEGRDSRLRPQRLEPFPRGLAARDRAFQLVTAPAFLAGRLRGPHT